MFCVGRGLLEMLFCIRFFILVFKIFLVVWLDVLNVINLIWNFYVKNFFVVLFKWIGNIVFEFKLDNVVNNDWVYIFL